MIVRLLASRIRASRSAAPLSLLLIGMSTVLIFISNRGLFYRDSWGPYSHFNLGEFSWNASKHLTVAVNFSFSHHLLGFLSQSVDVEGNIYSDPYNRFPPGGYVLIKLVTLPFGDDLSNRIYAAQVLVLGFYIGAAILAYWSLSRLISSRWIASTVTLMTFSSTQFLLFNDMILTELLPDLFGCILAFHGIVVFLQENRFRQLLIKSCLAVLLGWHVLAMLFTFIILSQIKEFVLVRKVRTVRDGVVSVFVSRYFVLGAVTLGLGILILAYNIGNEYYAVNIREIRQLTLSDLPSFNSMLRRTGLDSDRALDLPFFGRQFTRIGLMSLPFIWSDFLRLNSAENWGTGEPQNLIIGIFVVTVCIVGVVMVRHKLLAMTALLTGFCWSIPMYSQTTTHEYEALFYVGIPLFFYTLVLLLIRKGSSDMPLASCVALMVFVSSSYRTGYADRNDSVVEFHETVVEDFNVIREFARGGNTLVPIRDIEADTLEFVGARYGIHYYLSGGVIVFNKFECDRSLDEVDFMIQARRDKGLGLLTPDNQMMFLYDRYLYEERVDKLEEETEPIFQGDFGIYLTGNRELVFVSDRCDQNNSESRLMGSPIVLRVYPVDTEDLSDSEPDYELFNLDLVKYRVMDTKRHVVIFDLPDYDVASISIEQHADEGIWNLRFFGPEHVVDSDQSGRVDQAMVSREPIISGDFDVYSTDDGYLVYVREPCHSSDITEDFFVHVIPVDLKDLPEHRKQYEFDNLDFNFFDRGFKDGEKCAAMIKLPDYDIANIRTGQYNDEGPIWQSESDDVK